MTNLLRISLLGAATCLALAAGFAFAADADSPAASASASADKAAGDIAVTVNGMPITEADVNEIMKPTLERMSRSVAPNMLESYKAGMRQQIVERLVVEKLLDEKVKAANIVVSDQDLDAKLQEIASQQGTNLEALKAMLAAQGMNFEDIKGQVRKGLGYEKLISGESGGGFDVNEGDARKYYDEHIAEFNSPEMVSASHILIKPDPNGDPNQAKAKAKAQTEDLLKQVKDGADFAALAKQHSACPSAAKGGDLGMFGRGQMVKPFEDAAFALEPNQVSGIVETQFGYHIIKVAEHKPAGVMPFEQAKEQIISYLRGNKQDTAYQSYIERLKRDAKIVYPVGKEPKPVPASRPVQMAPAPK